MTKAQIFYYAAAVVIVTLSVYLYTSNDAQAPDSNSTSQDGNGGYNSTSNNNDIQNVDENKETDSNQDAPTLEEVISDATDTKKYTLTDVNWRWLRTESATGTIISEPETAIPFVLRLSNDNSMSSQTDCNNVAGTFEKNDNKLVFGPLMSTKMYCENSKEFEYTEQLSSVDSYTIIDNTLRLTLSNETGTMFFVRTK